MEWIKTNEQLPPKGQWVLVTTDDYQKPCEIECYIGVKKHSGYRFVNGKGEDFEEPYHAWTSGYGDIGESPIAWMPLPEPYREV